MPRRKPNLSSLSSAAASAALLPPPIEDIHTLDKVAADGFIAHLLGTSNVAAGKINAARTRCRRGNPFPLVALQWPELAIPADTREATIFRKNLNCIEPLPIPDQIKTAIFDRTNPVLRLDWWQHIIIAAFFEPIIGELFIAGATGVGKGASVCMACNLWFDVYTESRIHLTGRDKVHAQKNIFGETVKWRRRMASPVAGETLTERINDTERHYAMLLNPNISSVTAGEAFSGAHGKNTLYVFDEATSHPVSFLENARRNAKLIVALANPRSTMGWFRRGFDKLIAAGEQCRIGLVPGDLRMRLCMMIGGADCLNVRYQRLKVPVAPKGGLELSSELHG